MGKKRESYVVLAQLFLLVNSDPTCLPFIGTEGQKVLLTSYLDS